MTAAIDNGVASGSVTVTSRLLRSTHAQSLHPEPSGALIAAADRRRE
jgi:hypothetical protein